MRVGTGQPTREGGFHTWAACAGVPGQLSPYQLPHTGSCLPSEHTWGGIQLPGPAGEDTDLP